MPDELKVGDVVMVECHCYSCSVFGPPDPSEKNGPYIITQIGRDGTIFAKYPFGQYKLRHWNPLLDAVTFKVVGRADDAAEVANGG